MLTEDGCVLVNARFISGIIEGPNVGKNQARQVTGRHFFKNAAPKLVNEFDELRVAEGKKVEHEINGHMIMEQLEAGTLGKLRADRHLADCRRAKDHDEVRDMLPNTDGTDATVARLHRITSKK